MLIISTNLIRWRHGWTLTMQPSLFIYMYVCIYILVPTNQWVSLFSMQMARFQTSSFQSPRRHITRAAKRVMFFAFSFSLGNPFSFCVFIIILFDRYKFPLIIDNSRLISFYVCKNIFTKIFQKFIKTIHSNWETE